MLYYNYPYDDYYRFEESEEFDGLQDVNELYSLETEELPPQCPYRQFLPPIFPPNNFGGGSGGNNNAPSSPPPNFTPNKSTLQSQGGPSLKAVDPGAIRPCTFRFVYIWPRRGPGFWAYLTFVGRRSAAGFRWNGRRWTYFGIDLRRIDSFQCF